MTEHSLERDKARVLLQLKEKMFTKEVNLINEALKSDNAAKLIVGLKDSRLGLEIADEAFHLYVDQLTDYFNIVDRNLRLEEIRSVVVHCNALSQISISANIKDVNCFKSAMLNPDAHLENVQENSLDMYMVVIGKCVRLKGIVLSDDEIQTLVDSINQVSKKIVYFQAFSRGYLVRKKFKANQQNLRKINKRTNETIQRLLEWKEGCPPMELVRDALYQMEITEEDFALEIEIRKTIDQVSKHLRVNRALQEKINEADRKIGSLVRNSVVAFSHLDGSDLNPDDGPHCMKHTGINDFSKEGQAKLKAYERLFYLLQSDPRYLSTLLLRTSVSRVNSSLRPIIYSMFSWGALPIDGYRLVKFFKKTLEDEIHERVNTIEEFMKEPLMSVNLTLDFYRQFSGDLTSLIRPLVLKVLDTKKEKFILDPVAIYKNWCNQRETETGKACDLPQIVTADEALKFEVVKKTLDDMYEKVIYLSRVFVDEITSAEFINSIPYGVCYICKVIYVCLRSKFKDKTEKDILKAVGHVLYYRFLSPYIVSPDAFGVVTSGPAEKISLESRSNLGTISKILHSATNGKKWLNFGSLQANNFYHSLGISLLLNESHKKFEDCFIYVCEVPEPEEYYDINEYSDEALLFPPKITLSVKDLYQIHHWLYHFKTEIVPPDDIFHKCLCECGMPPSSPVDLICTRSKQTEGNNDVNAIELTLELHPIRVLSTKDQTESSTALKLKQAIIELVRYRHTCRDLNEVFFKPVQNLEESNYKQDRIRRAATVANNAYGYSAILSDHGRTLSCLLDYVKLNLKAFNAEKFDDILQQIASDVIYRLQYRNQQKRIYNSLKNTAAEMLQKTKALEDTLRCYNHYIDSCLKNLKKVAAKNRRSSKHRNLIIYKASASKLIEKGILLSLKDVEPGQRKSIIFHITCNPERHGVFDVSVIFRRVIIESIEIDLQDLLQLQFDGFTVYQLSHKATINVNLLIHLLNKKFYSF